MRAKHPVDKKKHISEANRLTRPPRLEGKVKNAKTNPKRKQKRKNV